MKVVLVLKNRVKINVLSFSCNELTVAPVLQQREAIIQLIFKPCDF